MLDKLSFVLLFASLMLCVGILKHNNVLNPIYSLLQNKIKNKRVLMSILSTVFGILPVPGRVTLATGCFDKCTKMHRHRGDLGVLAYLSTHHYYLWSPLEKSVLLVLGGLGLTYSEFLIMMLPYIAVLLVCTWFYIFFVMRDIEDVVIKFEAEWCWKKLLDTLVLVTAIVLACCDVISIHYIYTSVLLFLMCRYKPNIQQLISYIDFKMLTFTAMVIILSYHVHKHVDTIHDMLGSLSGNYGAHVALLFSFVASFLLGSSSKFSGIVVLLTPVYGLAMLPVFYIVDFCGYLLSPMHKCVLISNRYFKTKFVAFYKIVGIICLILIMQTIIIFYT